MSWLIESWHLLLPRPLCAGVLALVAVLCGAWVGIGRARKATPAGLRTRALVSLGSCAFTLVGYAFASNTGDSGRVAAQIVTGIGFLGAGAILHGRRIISGMTPAASIWMIAAIGMAVGPGYAIAGLALSILVNRLLVGFFLYETHWHPDLQQTS